MPNSVDKFISTFKKKTEHEGFISAVKRTSQAVVDVYNIKRGSIRNPDKVEFIDTLFINGCDYSVPHPIRYRVNHQMQQLESRGITCEMVDAWKMDVDESLSKARNFIIFRCPWTPEVGELIKRAKELNKQVYYDIDDLVIDTKYTDTIPYLKTMTAEEKASYDDGVNRMRRTMLECGKVITTTEGMAKELERYVPEVFINRNVASEEMIYFSEKTMYERDVLPRLQRNQVPANELAHWRYACNRQVTRAAEGIKIGYFSGSITHNADFDLVHDAIIRILKEHKNVHLVLVGEITLPEDMVDVADQITIAPFCNWQELPELIADVDINIAPLADSVFNRAKSENKWTEAALVKVPTVASNVGAFAHEIEDGKTGILCDSAEEWYDVLTRLITDKSLRDRIGLAAYKEVKAHHTSIGNAGKLANYITRNQTPNIMFTLPNVGTSGGILVAFKHACILQDAGRDVSILDNSSEYKKKFIEYDGHTFPVIHLIGTRNLDGEFCIRGHIDQAVATLWATVFPLMEYMYIGEILYLVQNYETDFYTAPDGRRISANTTYCLNNIKYLTISEWCKDWLEDDFHQKVAFAYNGINNKQFEVVKRDFDVSKIRILIEGDSESEYKNVDEAFRIVDLLDKDKFEIWYMSYNGKPKDTYHVDKFLHKVPHDEVGKVYGQCHILLKTSILESFSYPPLEMMATGGYVVVAPNQGNVEYIKDHDNCLTYEQGNLAAAVKCINEIVGNPELRAQLCEGGLRTAHERDWESIRSQVIELYR